jgi:GT2 family glycosyltransferase
VPPPTLSVVICTHNPRADFLSRTLASLRAQTLPGTEWELVVVDNASRDPIATHTDLSWHPTARVVKESELGLTSARLRGIAEARASVIVFVDDDNLLAPDYLARAVALAADWPQLGVWGCGNYTPEWEAPPAPEFAGYLNYLAVHRASRDRWSNQFFDYGATPAGAGLCARATVARRYMDNVRGDQCRKQLGRTGGSLGACEDFDLAFTAIAMGLGVGVFTELTMTHLMSRIRVEEQYLLRLVEGHACSTVLLHSLWDPGFAPPRRGALARLREFRLRSALDPIACKIHDARRRGEARAWAILAKPAVPT